jgi:hypothetical protein
VSLAGDTPLIATTRFIPVRGSDGEVVRVLGAFTDVTARKKMEAELVRNQEDLRTHNLAVGEILANGRDPVESFLEDFERGTGHDGRNSPKERGVPVILREL